MNNRELSVPNNVFARVGMSHVTEKLGDPYSDRMLELNGIRINTSSQPNSNPHFGTLTTLMCVFSVAEELQDFYKKPVKVTFDMLENAPDRKFNKIKSRMVNGVLTEYQLSLADSYLDNGTSLAENNMRIFRTLFDFFEKETGIETYIRSYNECQKELNFRKSLLKIFNNDESFVPIVAPTEGIIRLRFPCPDCKWVDKGSVNTTILSRANDEVIFKAFCPDHGTHTAVLNEESNDYFDTNTPLRDIAKVPGLVEHGKTEKTLPLMIDGRDWSGRWDRSIHIPGVFRLGYNPDELPARIYTPVVTDMLGAKLSKSLYVGNLYDSLPKGFADYEDFIKIYGDIGLRKLWEHIRGWAKDPAYMDRDSYSILYFSLLLEDKLPKATIMG